MADRRTIQLYDTRAADYARIETGPAEQQALADFTASLPPKSRVLDLGCGPGLASLAMQQAGHAPDPVDASCSMVDLANSLGLPARQAEFDAVTGRHIYDGLWANFSLLHAAKADFPRHLAALHRAAKPGAPFHIGMKLGTGESRDNLGRHYAYYTCAELTAHLIAAGFHPQTTVLGEAPGFAGTVSPFALILSRVAPVGQRTT